MKSDNGVKNREQILKNVHQNMSNLLWVLVVVLTFAFLIPLIFSSVTASGIERTQAQCKNQYSALYKTCVQYVEKCRNLGFLGITRNRPGCFGRFDKECYEPRIKNVPTTQPKCEYERKWL